MGHYEVLGVAPSASAAELRRAYLARARQHHPDAGGHGGAMTEVNEAWAVLSDPSRRRRYDLAQAGAEASPAVDSDETWVGRPGGEGSPTVGTDGGGWGDDRPVRPGTRRGTPAWLPLVPPGLFAAAVALGCVGLAVGAPFVVGAAGVLFLLSCVAVAAVALLTLRGGPSRR